MKNLNLDIEIDRKAIDSINAIPLILEMICQTTGMGYATVARVTKDRWIACAVLDNIDFDLPAGGELKVETTLCHEVEQYHKPIVIDDFTKSEQYVNHHTPVLYGLQSYISIPITLKDGRFFGTLCAIDRKPAQIENKQIIGMFQLYAELIAVHIENYERLQNAEARLLEEKQIAELREQFIAVLGHDLRNPAGAVKNVAQLLNRGGIDEKAIKRFSGILLNASSRMMDLIDNLMDFARGRLGSGINLNKSEVQLREPLQHIVDEIKLIWPEKTILIEMDLQQPVVVDAKRIAQLFSNLLSNAVNHGKSDQPVKVAITSSNEKFFLSVKNRGDKISDLQINKLFEPFV